MVRSDSNNYVNFEEACVIMQESFSYIDTVKAWFEFSKTPGRDQRIPADPYNYYSRRGEWPKNGWSIFLSNLRVSNIAISEGYLSYSDAMEFCHSMDIRTPGEYHLFVKENRLQTQLPLAPDKYYRKTTGSFSWKKFLAPKFFKNINDAVKAIAESKISFLTYSEWQKISKSKRPAQVPSNPFTFYNISLEAFIDLINKYKALNNVDSFNKCQPKFKGDRHE